MEDLNKEGPDDVPDLNQDSSISFLLEQTPNTFEFKDFSDLEMDGWQHTKVVKISL